MWKSSVAGVLLVVVAGVIVGVALRSHTPRVRTVTVDHTVTIRAAAETRPPAAGAKSASATTTASASQTGSAGAASGTGSATSTTSSGSQEYYATYLSTQDTGQLDSNGSNASLDGDPASLQLKGQTYSQAVAFDVSPGCCPEHVTEGYQLPTPGFRHFSASVAGLATDASANAAYKLVIYKNNDNPGATVLYSAVFTGPSGTHPVSFDTQGATDIVLEWTNLTQNEPDNQDQFILANPIVMT